MHFPHIHIHYTLNRELTELYASMALHNFTIGLVRIFEPIYFYIYFSESISKTLLFFGAVSFLFGILSPFAGKVVTKIGVKHSMLFSIPFLFAYYFLLWHIEKLGEFYLVLVPIAVIHNLLYWPAFHIDFSRFSEKRNRGKQLSYRHTIAALAAAASPLFGGIILVKFGYPPLFAIVLVMLFVSVFPLFLSKEVHGDYEDSFKQSFRDFFSKKYRRRAIAFFAEGGEGTVHLTIWPIFLFVLAISYSSIGIISSVALGAGLLFGLYLGRITDTMRREKLLYIGSWLNALTWPIKMFVATPFDAFLANTLHSLTRLSALIPFAALFYDWTSRENIDKDRSIIFREMVLNTTRGVLLFALAVVFLFTDNLAITFPIAGALSLMLAFFANGERAGSVKTNEGKGKIYET